MSKFARRFFRLIRYGVLCTLYFLLSACASRIVVNPTTPPTPTQEVRVIQATAAPATSTPAPPFAWPSPPPAPAPACTGAPRTRLILHERGWVLPNDPRPINLRSGPGTAYRVLSIIPTREVFVVVDGPVCSGGGDRNQTGYAWFKVRYKTVEGWIAEGDLTSYFVDVYPPG